MLKPSQAGTPRILNPTNLHICGAPKDPLRHKEAEQYLLAFQASAEPLPACQYILEHSASDVARFQAALTLKKAVLRDWPLLGPENKSALRAYLLHHVFK